METIPAHAGNGIESDLIDLGSMSMAASHRWRSGPVRAAMRNVVHGARKSAVYDQTRCDDGSN
ncbi:MAG: hypothetical protein ABW224_02130 [Kibdelosporangium sp.]